jgi:ABC-type sulfate transport system permease component
MPVFCFLRIIYLVVMVLLYAAKQIWGFSLGTLARTLVLSAPKYSLSSSLISLIFAFLIRIGLSLFCGCDFEAVLMNLSESYSSTNPRSV